MMISIKSIFFQTLFIKVDNASINGNRINQSGVTGSNKFFSPGCVIAIRNQAPFIRREES